MFQRTIFVLLPFLVAGLGTSSLYAQEPNETDIRAKYNGPDTPDEVVFKSWLELVVFNDTVEDYSSAHFVQDAFKLDHDEEGWAIASKASQAFTLANEGIQQDIRNMENLSLCGPYRSEKSYDEVYATLDSVDDEREVIARRHYLATLNRLPPEAAAGLREALDKMKLQYDGGKTKHKSMYEGASLDVKNYIEILCLDWSREAKP